jgi:hypothetical protein
MIEPEDDSGATPASKQSMSQAQPMLAKQTTNTLIEPENEVAKGQRATPNVPGNSITPPVNKPAPAEPTKAGGSNVTS